MVEQPEQMMAWLIGVWVAENREYTREFVVIGTENDAIQTCTTMHEHSKLPYQYDGPLEYRIAIKP